MNTLPPNSERIISIELPPAEGLKLEKAAAAKKMTVQDFVAFIIQVSTHQMDDNSRP